MIAHEILGDDMQALVLTLGGGDVVRAEAGALMYMTDNVEMDARMDGGLLGGLKRKLLAGEKKQVPLTITNQGQGLLQGTLTVAEGQDWLSIVDGKKVFAQPISATQQQPVTLYIDTKGVAVPTVHVVRFQ